MNISRFGKGNIRSGQRKLTPMDVIEIRKRRAAGETQASLCREYRVTVGTIGRIVRGESWQAFQQCETDFEIESMMARAATPVSPEEIRRSQEKLAELLRQPAGTVQITPDVVAEDSPGVRRFIAETEKFSRQVGADKQLDDLTKEDPK